MPDSLFLPASTFYQAIITIFRFLTANYFQKAPDSSLPPQIMAMKHIVILGASYAGVSTAHRLLKQSSKTGPIKITLVSPNTHFYWSMASSRGIVPGQFIDEQLFQPIAEGFKRYPSSRFEFIVASAESLDVKGKKAAISGSDGKKDLEYDFLVLATGSRSKGDLPFKGLGETEETMRALHEFQDRVEKAETIVVAGAGVMGVEVAGELAFEYGGVKKVILVCPKHFHTLSTTH